MQLDDAASPPVTSKSPPATATGAHPVAALRVLVWAALGVVFGDIGTSPLYVFQTIMGERPVSELLVYGGVSAVFWTLTLQTSIKYILLTLEADNHGEGGIFSLFSLVKSRGRWLLWPAIIGAGTLLADGIITPPISVTSAIEGLKILYPTLNQETIVIVVIAIISLLFAFQQFGTKVVGAAFGPIMLVWFSVIGTLGVAQIMHHPGVLVALNPMYAVRLLVELPARAHIPELVIVPAVDDWA